MTEINNEKNNLNLPRSTPPRTINTTDADDLAEIDLLGLVTAVLRRWKLCAAICGVMIAAGLAYCLMVPTQYLTTSRVFVDVGQLKTTPKDEVQFVLSGKVLQKVFDDFKFGETKAFVGDSEPMKHFRNLYDVKEVPKTSLIEIAFKDPDVKHSAAVNVATAEGYINDVRNRVRRVLVSEQTVLQAVLDQWIKERTEAADALGAFKTKHGIVALDEQRNQTEDDLSRAAAATAAAAAASPLLSQSGATRLTYVAEPVKRSADRKKLIEDQATLKKELVRLDALVPEYQRLNGRYLAALSAYQQAFNAVKEQAAKIERLNGDALARIAVPPSDDENVVKKQPAKAKVMAVVVLASLVLSVLVCVVLELLDRTVKTRREFERLTGLSVLAEVKSSGKPSEDEKWQTAATLLDLGAAEDPKVFLTMKPSAVKTDISAAVKLAVAFAKNSKKVLLVSLDATTDVEKWLRTNGGLLEESSRFTSDGLMCWPATVDEAEFEVCSTSSVCEVLQMANKTEYDVVLLEIAPLADSADVLNVVVMAGVHTVVVGELRQTKRDEVVDAMQMLDRVKADVVGSVLLGE